MLRLRTFGALSLERDGAPLDDLAAQRKALALLAVLAASGSAGIGRERVMALFWPESAAARARGALKQMLHTLRRQLGAADAILGTAELRLNPDRIGSDVQSFHARIAEGDLEQAAAEYTGVFLDGAHIDSAGEFERWVDGERAKLARMRADTLEALAHAAGRRGEAELAVELWRRLQTADRLSGRVALGLMKALEAAGDRAGALRHARIHEILLRDELDADPDPARRCACRPPRVADSAAPAMDAATRPRAPAQSTTTRYADFESRTDTGAPAHPMSQSPQPESDRDARRDSRLRCCSQQPRSPSSRSSLPPRSTATTVRRSMSGASPSRCSRTGLVIPRSTRSVAWPPTGWCEASHARQGSRYSMSGPFTPRVVRHRARLPRTHRGRSRRPAPSARPARIAAARTPPGRPLFFHSDPALRSLENEPRFRALVRNCG